MNDEIQNNQTTRGHALPPELEALDARFAELGAAERAGAPAGLEARIVAATAGITAARSQSTRVVAPTLREPVGVIGRLSVRRLDWPMRVAAVIAVMIGGWAVVQGINGPRGGPGAAPAEAGASFNPDEVFDYVFGKTGTSEIQRLLLDTTQLDSLIQGDDFSEPENGDQESL